MTPTLLLDMTIDGLTYHLSDTGQYNVDGEIYVQQLIVNNITDNELDFSMNNGYLQASSAILNLPDQLFRQIPVKLYEYIPQTGYKSLRFAGFADSVVGKIDFIVISCVAARLRRQVPDRYISPPDFNHIISADKTISFGRDKIILQKGDV